MNINKNPKGYSLHIGLNKVNPIHYKNWQGKLSSAENDARAMAKIAASRGFMNIKILLGKNATKEKLLQCIQEYALILKKGDLFFITFSGHGIKIDDKDFDETYRDLDYKDEGWCMYDDIIIDDEISIILDKFKGGLRVVLISDSCYSGSLIEDLKYSRKSLKKTTPAKVIFRNKKNKSHGDTSHIKLRAFASSKGYQLSGSVKSHGRFTKNIIDLFSSTRGKINYQSMFKKIHRIMPKSQKPVYLKLGYGKTKFDKNKIFQI